MRRYRPTRGARVHGRKLPAIDGEAMEALELRQLLDSTVVFNEIMYHPAGDEAALEWVELNNQNAVDMDLTGWRLDGGIHYAFPSGTILHGGKYVVVALSPAGLQAATNFAGAFGPFTGRLDNPGEKLELINNNGRLMDSVEYGDSGAWPVGADGGGVSLAKRDPQMGSAAPANWTVSAQINGTPGALNFVTGEITDTLISSSATARALVPADGLLGTAWQLPGFDDASWTSGALGVGFGNVSPPQPPVGYWNLNNSSNDTSGNGFNGTPTNGPIYSTDVPAVIGGTRSMQFDGVNDYFVTPNLTNAVSGDDSLTVSLWFKPRAGGLGGVVLDEMGQAAPNTNWHDSQIEVQTNGEVKVRVWSLAAVSLGTATFGQWHHVIVRYNSATQTMDGFLDGVEASQDVVGQRSAPWENGAQQYYALGATDSTNMGNSRYFDGLIDDFAIWNKALSNTQAVALFNKTSPLVLTQDAGAVQTNIGPAMQNVNASAYVRVPFGPINPTAYDRLSFRMRYDDGFVAYLNGVEVARRNAPTPLLFNSPSTSSQAPLVDEMIDITGFLGALQPGINVLAVQGLNASAGDADFLVYPTLTARRATGQVNLTLNEVSGTLDSDFFVEIGNPGGSERNLAGVVIATSSGQEYTLPSQTIVPGSQVTITSAQMGFTPLAEDKLFLFAPGKSGLYDAVVVKTTARARCPDLTGRWLRPNVPTPSAANSFALHDQIVINEIMYHARPTYGPTFMESSEEWVELYNRSAAAVDLTGWSLAGGPEFTFAPGTILAPDGYIVVSNNAAALALKFPAAAIVGDFSGNLSDSSDTIKLIDDMGNPADEVTYFDAGRWSHAADGGGATLELRDPLADNSLGEAWAASDESSRTTWQNYSYRMNAVAPVYGPAINFNELVLGLLNDGEVLLDNIKLIENPATTAVQMLQNVDFQNDTIGTLPLKWRIQGTHEKSRVIVDPANPNNKVLDLVATGPSNYMSNHAETTLRNSLTVVNGRQYEISFDARWVSGSPQLRTEAYYARLAKTTIIAQPNLAGTPGSANSRYAANIAPTFDKMIHDPLIPNANQAITVSVAASDPDGISLMKLWYSVNGGVWASTTMSGINGGLYTGTIPGQAAGAVIQFYVEGTDGLGAVSTFPTRGRESRALIKVQDGKAQVGPRHVVRMVMTTADVNTLHLATNMLDDDLMGATVYYDEREVFYDVGVRLRGSMFSRNSASGTGYHIELTPEHLFRGVHETITIKPREKSEILVKHLANETGVPNMYDDLAQMLTPSGQGDGIGIMGMARYESEYLDTQFKDGSEGTLYKFEGIREMLNNTGAENLKTYQPVGWIQSFDLRDLGNDKEMYRWSLQLGSNRDEDDFSRLMDMCKALGLTGAQLQTAIANVIDVDQWMRTFALLYLTGIADVYSVENPHNMSFYRRPEDNKIIALPWDWGFAFSQGTNASIIPGANIGKVVNLLPYKRLYYGNILDLIQTKYNTAYMSYWTAHYGALAGEGYSGVDSYINARGSFAMTQLPQAQPTFQITTNGGANQTVSTTTVTLRGDAWINIRDIKLAGNPQPLQLKWIDIDTWEAVVPLANGANPLTFQAYDFHGNLIASDSVTITSTATGPTLNNSIKVTEMMYHPADPPAGSQYDSDDFEYIELQNVSNTAFNLSGVNFSDGIVFTFGNVNMTAGQRLLLVKNQAAFQSRYGSSIPIAGTYVGSLNNAGETISLTGTAGEVIQQFTYKDTWYPITDGEGYSLVVADPASGKDLNDQDNWRPSNLTGGLPGDADPGYAPASIAINEAVVDSTADLGDWVEIKNILATQVDISGWFFSDSANDLMRYVMPAGSVIPAGGYLVMYENQFGFDLSSTGTNLYLTNIDSNGQPAGYREHIDFTHAEPDAAFGRYITASGNSDIVLLQQPTPGSANSQPVIGPVTISEILYHPVVGGDEFIELQNVTADDVALFDDGNPVNTWRFLSGVTFEFPQGASVPGQGVALVVSIEPDAFRTKYSIPASVPIFGPWLVSDPLNNAGDDIKLARPGTPQNSVIPYILVDKVKYEPQSPWPVEADTIGASLQRKSPGEYGNDPTNWEAGAVGGSPGYATIAQLPPVVSAGIDAAIVAGTTFTRDGSFSDVNVDQSWTATVNYGDGGATAALPLDADKTFHLNHIYATPGLFTLTVTITDNLGGAGVASFIVYVNPAPIQGTAAPDRFVVKLNSAGTMVQFFVNNATATPNFSVAMAGLSTATFNGLGSYDTLTIDMANGNPIPPGGYVFNGGPQVAPGDLLKIINSAQGLTVNVDTSSASVGGRTISFTSVEAIQVDGGAGNDTMHIVGSVPFLPVLTGNGGIDTLQISAGGYAIDVDQSDRAENLIVDGSASVTFEISQHLASFSLTQSATAMAAPFQNVLLRTSALTIADSASLDLADAALIVQSTPAARQGALEAITGWIASGRNAGVWNGPGIVSSLAAADLAALTGVGVILNGKEDNTPEHATFGGEDVDINTILAKQNWNGDLDLSGAVDADDYFRIDLGFSTDGAGYARGDIDGSGEVDADDYFLIDSAFAGQSGLLGAGEAAVRVRAVARRVTETRAVRAGRHHAVPLAGRKRERVPVLRA